MRKYLLFLAVILMALPLSAKGSGENEPGGDAGPKTVLDEKFQTDAFEINGKILKIHMIGHGTLAFQYDGKIIHVDPVSRSADYSILPKADLILITHSHGDHLDGGAVSQIRKEGTVIIVTDDVSKKLGDGEVMEPGDIKTALGLKIEAVPAYNTTEGRDNFHPKDRDNGFIITFGNKRVYIAGDTENTPEMKKLKNIYIAFLPMNQPYTMLPEQVADAAKAFKPEILYPYHYGSTPLQEIKDLMKEVPGVELRIRKF